MKIPRGAGNVLLFTTCVLVLLGFLVAVAYGLGHAMVSLVGGLADNGGGGAG